MMRKHGRILFSCLLLAAVGAGCVEDRSYLDEAQRVHFSYFQSTNWALPNILLTFSQSADP